MGPDTRDAPNGMYSLDMDELVLMAPNLEALVVDCSEMSRQCYSEEDGPWKLYVGGAHRLPPGLRSLTLTHADPFSCSFIRGLARLEHLTRLHLPSCQIPSAPLVLRGLTHLEDVQLGSCSSEGVGRGLSPLRALLRMRRLSLEGCDLRGRRADLGPGWPALQELDLAHAKLPSQASWLASLSPQLTRLGLDVQAAAAGDIKLSSLVALRRLDLHLFKATGMPRLPTVPGSGVSPPAEMLSDALPGLEAVVKAISGLALLAKLGLPGIDQWADGARSEVHNRIRQQLQPLAARSPPVAIAIEG